jgi:cytoskeleton protein RodZ
MTDIGATLREARMRARIDVSEIEATTKIRAKYLRALENEEWDLLPGPTFVRTFLRTYAQALGLDSKALVEEYRLRYELPSESEHQPVVSSAPRSRSRSGPRSRPARGAPAPSRGYMIATGAIALVIVLLIYGLLSNKGSSPSTTTKTGADTARTHNHGVTHAPTPSELAHGVGGVGRGTVVALSLEPSAPVYVCLIDAAGRKRIPGVIIQPPYTRLTYHSTRFEITLGNSAVTMYINGQPFTVPPSSRPTGYVITSAGRHTLEAAQQPTCT